ncbi:MAG: replication-associated recombination protein A [Desulfocapsaceae bacterium]|nr:replication-associated recombination protein A [Desulfocapsaceae bacterium]
MTNQMNIIDPLGLPTNIPLAEKVRPTRLDNIYGQDSLLQEGSVLRSMIDKDEFSSFILWGPPGTGKTTIARYIEKNTSLGFVAFSAVLSKIGKVKEIMERADYLLRAENRKTIVFIDEIHRFNKSQQDAFLPYVESGAVILFGATTENPSFEVIPALMSRCHVFVLKHLEEEEIIAILRRGVSCLDLSSTLDEEILKIITHRCGGDARRALNNLEMICRRAGQSNEITPEFALEALSSRSLFYDKRGEEHYNLVSALHKSIRGSDPQAALYWLARMLESGEDPMYLVRRMVRIASEDIGLADPNALTQAIAVKEAVHFLGMPEANTAMTQLVVYLAAAPKSNGCEVAFLKAQKDALSTAHLKVPLHICNAPTKLMADLGYGKNYKYAHDFEEGYAYQKCFPDEMQEKTYYSPSQFGFEKEIAKRLQWWHNLKKKQQKK